MFERFTDRARRVVVLAQEEARLLNHNYIGTEHLLLGLIREREGVAAKALEQLGVSLETVRAHVEEVIGQGGSMPTGHIPFTPRAKKVLELSLREALQLGHNYIGTEHLLLGLIREGQGVAAQVLVNLGADLSRVRHEVIQLLSGYRPEPVSPLRAEGGQTPAATRATSEAKRLAEEGPVGSHHLLRAVMADDASLAAKALAALGVTLDDVEGQLAVLDPAGTSDELPEVAGARQTTVEIIGDKVAVLFEDDDLRDRLAGSLRGQPMVIRSGDPAAAAFPRLWKAFNPILADIVWRLEKEAAERWRPPEWDRGWEVAAYAVVQSPGGLESHLEVADGVDRHDVRAGLAAWLTANQPKGDDSVTYLSILVDRSDDPTDWGRVARLDSGVHADRPQTQLQFLVAHAILDLAQPASPAS